MGKLFLYIKDKDGDRIFLDNRILVVATICIRNGEIIVNAKNNEFKRELEKVINGAIRENKVVKGVIKDEMAIRYYGGEDPRRLPEEIRKRLEKAYEDIPLKPNDPEFLRYLGCYLIQIPLKFGDHFVYPNYEDERETIGTPVSGEKG
jgi:hypothetical protein